MSNLRRTLSAVVLLCLAQTATAQPSQMDCRDIGWFNALRAAHDITDPTARSKRLAVLFTTDEWQRALGGLVPFMTERAADDLRLFTAVSRTPPHTVPLDLRRRMASLRLPPFCAFGTGPPFMDATGIFGGWQLTEIAENRTPDGSRGPQATRPLQTAGLLGDKPALLGIGAGVLCVMFALLRRESANQRRAARFPCRIAVSVCAAEGTFAASIRDLSQRGCRLQSQKAGSFEPGDQMVVAFPDGPMPAVTVWQCGDTIGVRFSGLLRSRRLQRLLSQRA